ncbi:MAG: methyltransferase domain-containing protein [Acidobacteriia bacterium]|nr:methyltransferase domain-containing protein [Terriglobia bacterium]
MGAFFRQPRTHPARRRRRFRRRLSRRCPPAPVTSSDPGHSARPHARHLPRNGVGTVAADALALPFRDASFDLVACSLLIHHLERPEIVRFVNEALRVARVAVLLNDLRRQPLHLALIYAGFPLFSRVTRHDGVASVRRAYTPEEIRSILRESGAASVEVENHYLYRMGVLVWKRASP